MWTVNNRTCPSRLLNGQKLSRNLFFRRSRSSSMWTRKFSWCARSVDSKKIPTQYINLPVLQQHCKFSRHIEHFVGSIISHLQTCCVSPLREFRGLNFFSLSILVFPRRRVLRLQITRTAKNAQCCCLSHSLNIAIRRCPSTAPWRSSSSARSSWSASSKRRAARAVAPDEANAFATTLAEEISQRQHAQKAIGN